MVIFVTGVNGQLGHDVMNELAKRGYEGIGSDLAPAYRTADDSAAASMPYKTSFLKSIPMRSFIVLLGQL